MRLTMFPIIFAASLVISMTEALAAPGIQAGLWEVSIASSVGGMEIPVVNQQFCFGDKEIADVKQLLPNAGNCDINNTGMSLNSGSWSFQCKGEPSISGNIDLHFDSNSFSGNLNLTISGNIATIGGQGNSPNSGGSTTQIREKLTAHRVGNCEALR